MLRTVDREKCIRCGRRVPKLSWWGNLGLSIYKLVVGVLGGSSALIADAFHSFTDVIGTTVIIVSCRVSDQPPDACHPYGHGKAEFMSSAFIYLVLLVLSIGFFVGGLLVILHTEMQPPKFVTLLGAIVSILYNVLMYSMGQCAGKRNNSPALLANSFENRADAISSIAVVVGIALAIFVHPICDPLAAMAVGVIIFINCLVQLREAMAGLLDKSLPAQVVDRIRQVALAHRGIKGVSFIKTRPMGTHYWLDLGIQVKGEIPLERAEAIAAELKVDLMRRSRKFHCVEVYIAPEGSSE